MYVKCADSGHWSATFTVQETLIKENAALKAQVEHLIKLNERQTELLTAMITDKPASCHELQDTAPLNFEIPLSTIDDISALEESLKDQQQKRNIVSN